MLFGLIVGGILGGVMYIVVESVFGNKIGRDSKKNNYMGRCNNWFCFC